MRLALAAVAAALVVAGGAAGAPAAHTFPKLLVQEQGPTTTVEIVHDELDDAAADLTIYSPAGYDTAFSQPAGTTIATARGLVTAPDLGLTRIVVAGSVTVRDPSSLAEASERCTGTDSHAAFWLLTLRGSGATLELPLYVDAATPANARFASASIRACLPPPDLPAGTPGRAPLGFELGRVALTFQGVFRAAPAGERRWRLVETEYVRATGQPNPADRSEAQAVVYAGGSLALASPTVEATGGLATVTLHGRTELPANAEASYRLYRGLGRGTLRAFAPLQVSGRALATRFRIRQTRETQVLYVQARGAVTTLGLGPSFCRPTFRAEGVPCVYGTRMGARVTSAIRRVVVPPA